MIIRMNSVSLFSLPAFASMGDVAIKVTGLVLAGKIVDKLE